MSTNQTDRGPASKGRDKPTARSYSAAANTTRGLSPLDWGDKCFLCGNSIGEGAPQGFWQSRKGGFYRCHRGCIDVMEANGGHPKDFHRVKEAQQKKQPPVHVQPEKAPPIDEILDEDEIPPHLRDEAPTDDWTGPRVIQFDDFEHMQGFISQRGPIPSQVRVMIGDYVVQAGG